VRGASSEREFGEAFHRHNDDAGGGGGGSGSGGGAFWQRMSARRESAQQVRALLAQHSLEAFEEPLR
jgi:Spy/CpxP family protein refolding chaperone